MRSQPALRQKRALFVLTTILLLAGMHRAIQADGLPGEYVVNNRWHDLFARYSPLNNAALVAEENQLTIRGAFALTMQGAFRLWESGVTLPLNTRHCAGVSLLGQNDGAIQSAVFDETSNTLVAGNSEMTNNNLFTMFTYAMTPLERFSIGANVNIAYQSNFGNAVSGVGLDLGCLYRIANHDAWGYHAVGVSTVNLVSPSMAHSISPDFGNEGQYSRNLRVSWLAEFLDRQLEAGTDLDFRDFLSDVHEFDAGVNPDIEWGVSTRFGGWLWRTLGLFAQTGFDQRVLEYWGIATGIKMPLGDQAPEIQAFYNYNTKIEGEQASSHTFYLLMRFGKRRDSRTPSEKASDSDTGSLSGDSRAKLSALKGIAGIKVEEEKEYVRITTEEIAVHFASGSADLPADALPALREIASFVRTYPGHPVEIQGHTDNDPITGKLKEKFPDNNALSKARCEAVKDYFVTTEKLPENLFTTKGFGERRPIAPNDTKESKYKNRRVVIVIKK